MAVRNVVGIKDERDLSHQMQKLKVEQGQLEQKVQMTWDAYRESQCRKMNEIPCEWRNVCDKAGGGHFLRMLVPIGTPSVRIVWNREGNEKFAQPMGNMLWEKLLYVPKDEKVVHLHHLDFLAKNVPLNEPVKRIPITKEQVERLADTLVEGLLLRNEGEGDECVVYSQYKGLLGTDPSFAIKRFREVFPEVLDLCMNWLFAKVESNSKVSVNSYDELSSIRTLRCTNLLSIYDKSLTAALIAKLDMVTIEKSDIYLDPFVSGLFEELLFALSQEGIVAYFHKRFSAGSEPLLLV